MNKFLEKMVDWVSVVVFCDEKKKEEKKKAKKDVYTLSSVFPSQQIMREVEKHL